MAPVSTTKRLQNQVLFRPERDIVFQPDVNRSVLRFSDVDSTQPEVQPLLPFWRTSECWIWIPEDVWKNSPGHQSYGPEEPLVAALLETPQRLAFDSDFSISDNDVNSALRKKGNDPTRVHLAYRGFVTFWLLANSCSGPWKTKQEYVDFDTESRRNARPEPEPEWMKMGYTDPTGYINDGWAD